MDLVAAGGTNPASSPVMLAPIITTVETKKSYEYVTNMENRRESIGNRNSRKKKIPVFHLPKIKTFVDRTFHELVFPLRETEKGEMRVS